MPFTWEQAKKEQKTNKKRGEKETKKTKEEKQTSHRTKRNGAAAIANNDKNFALNFCTLTPAVCDCNR